MKYNTFSVKFEHTTVDSETPRQNRIVVTIYGDSEFAQKSAIEKLHPEYTNVVILESESR